MKKLYEGNIKRNFFSFALPLIITILFSQAYNIINTIMAGHLIGDDAISAIGSTAPLISFISSLCWGYGTGISIYVAVLFGREDYKRMANVIKTNMSMVSVLVIILSAFCILFHNNIFDFLNIEPSMRKDAFAYYSIYIAGLVFLNINWCGVYIANALGLTKLPLIASVITNILNISINYILIKVFGMGVEATAIATIFSAFCVSIFYVVMMINTFNELKVNNCKMYFSFTELKYSLSFAFPSMLQQSVMYLSSALVSPLTNLCGASAIAGYTIGMRIYDVNAGVYQNSNKTISTFIAQCVGAGKQSIIKKGIKTGLFQTIMFLLIFLIPTVFLSDPISRLFLDSKEGLHYSVIFMKCCMPFVFFNVINNLIHAIFRSAGAGQYLVISTLIYAVSRCAYSYLLFDKYEMYGIYAAMVLSWITEAIFGLIIYCSGKWKSPEYKAFEKIKDN